MSTVALYPDADGYWTCFTVPLLSMSKCYNEQGTMRSGSLVHRVPCWGYCYQQKVPLVALDENGHRYVRDVRDGKKVAIFGDTADSR